MEITGGYYKIFSRHPAEPAKCIFYHNCRARNDAIRTISSSLFIGQDPSSRTSHEVKFNDLIHCIDGCTFSSTFSRIMKLSRNLTERDHGRKENGINNTR